MPHDDHLPEQNHLHAFHAALRAEGGCDSLFSGVSFFDW